MAAASRDTRFGQDLSETAASRDARFEQDLARPSLCCADLGEVAEEVARVGRERFGHLVLYM